MLGLVKYNLTHLFDRLQKANVKLVTAESCTGGMIAAAITEVSGSSAVFDRGFITYSNSAKHEILGVSPSLTKGCGAVSSQVAQAMAEGAIDKSDADISIAVTGIAGPTGAVEGKPVGTVFIASKKRQGSVLVERHHFDGNRALIRQKTLKAAFALVEKQIST